MSRGSPSTQQPLDEGDGIFGLDDESFSPNLHLTQDSDDPASKQHTQEFPHQPPSVPVVDAPPLSAQSEPCDEPVTPVAQLRDGRLMALTGPPDQHLTPSSGPQNENISAASGPQKKSLTSVSESPDHQLASVSEPSDANFTGDAQLGNKHPAEQPTADFESREEAHSAVHAPESSPPRSLAEVVPLGWNCAVVAEHHAVARAALGPGYVSDPPEAPSPDQPTPSPMRPTPRGWTGRTVARAPNFASSTRARDVKPNAHSAEPARVPKVACPPPRRTEWSGKTMPVSPKFHSAPQRRNGDGVQRPSNSTSAPEADQQLNRRNKEPQQKVTHKWNGATTPLTPNFLNRTKEHETYKSEAYDRKIAAINAHPTKSTWTGATIPVTPKLSTSSRLGSQKNGKSSDEIAIRSRESRAARPTKSAWNGATRPIPPKLSQSSRLGNQRNFKSSDSIGTLSPESRELEMVRRDKLLYEQDRKKKKAFIQRLSMTTDAPPPPKREMTLPQTPVLFTNLRAAAHKHTTLSTEQLDQLEAQKKFVAHPLNPKLFDTPPQTTRSNPALTVPESPAFRVAQRVPKALMEQSPPQPKAPKIQWTGKTESRAPRLSTGVRHSAGSRASIVPVEPVPSQFKARPLPDFNQSFQAHTERSREPARTKTQPFRLSMSNAAPRNTYTTNESPDKVFRARPMPDFDQIDPPQEPRCSPTKGTQAKPFKFESSRRSQVHAAKLASMRKEEELEAERGRRFIARPMPDPDDIFVLDKLASPVLRDTLNVSLRVERRALERSRWEVGLAEKQRKSEEHEKELERLRGEQEEVELRAFRESLSFRARPAPPSH